jgi:hypothetical protein
MLLLGGMRDGKTAHASINENYYGSGGVCLCHEADSFYAEVSLRWDAEGVDPERDGD